jgi:hypothetical protein
MDTLLQLYLLIKGVCSPQSFRKGFYSRGLYGRVALDKMYFTGLDYMYFYVYFIYIISYGVISDTDIHTILPIAYQIYLFLLYRVCWLLCLALIHLRWLQFHVL